MTRSRDVADTQDNIGGAVAPFVAGKNKIHNGNMAISQKGAGPFSISVNSVQTLDRWRASGWSGGTETGVVSIEQSTDAPSGFTNSLKLTVTTADTTIASTETYGFLQAIEANNIQSELEYGTATAKALTISFWVKGSVAGTYGAAWQANGTAYGGTGWAYVFSFPVTTSWARVSVTIPGLTTGGIPTFISTQTFGFLRFDIGSGTTFNGTLNAWQTGNIRTYSGATQMIATSGATLNMTGVQVEFGNVVTPFTTASGSYGSELALCQRYYQKSYNTETAPATNTTLPGIVFCASGNVANLGGIGQVPFKVEMRAAPTVTIYSYTSSQTNRVSDNGGTDLAAASGTANYIGTRSFEIQNGAGTITAAYNGFIFHYVASAEL